MPAHDVIEGAELYKLKTIQCQKLTASIRKYSHVSKREISVQTLTRIRPEGSTSSRVICYLIIHFLS